MKQIDLLLIHPLYYAAPLCFYYNIIIIYCTCTSQIAPAALHTFKTFTITEPHSDPGAFSITAMCPLGRQSPRSRHL